MTARAGILSAAFVLLTACDTGSDDASGDDAAAQVTVAVAQPATFGERFSLTGTLTAERDARLSPRVDGLVARVHVDAGDRVTAGQALVELDPAVGRQALARVRAQVAEADAAAQEAERLFTEAQRLGEGQFIAASQIDARESELRLARAALDSARASEREQAELVERHVLPAPFDGVVAEKLAEAGEWVQRGTPVLSLVATDRVRLDVQVPQERYADLGDDADVQVYADALGGETLRATIGARVPVTDAGARTFLLRLLVDDPQDRLLPGTSARAEVSLPAREPALAVSRDALLRQPDGSYSLFVVEAAGASSDSDAESPASAGTGAGADEDDDAANAQAGDGKASQGGDGNGDDAASPPEVKPDTLVARQRTVRVLRDQGDEVAISEGLSAGERVVVRGNEALVDGQPVRVAPER
ncbi:efflux RND transporter periplasmic adaptor subunit [Luteimonas terrae]|uniref:RND family efflux transporter MFP subunit n=1 Tax=Luteimonas terrae TaxID=1530191 RepID=A0ABU1Y049_9GAMM|nr:efflux RND transporter periplasmic adaptor subunit [Luteimonas terrae]MDR7193661.1 RND family efflux transporter MFP subunit [Luteimonas terrae]